MRSARMLVGIALVAAVAGCGAANAAERAATWVEVSPGTVPAGSLLAIRGDCVDNDGPATVTSPAFGTVTLQPRNSRLEAETRVPAGTAAGRYEVKLTCDTGDPATTTVTVVTPTPTQRPTRQPTVGPNSGGGYLGNGNQGSGGL